MGKLQIIVFLTMFVLLLNCCSALETFEQNTNIDIKQPVRIDGGLPKDTLCNITVYYPNKSLLVDFKEMTEENSYYNYTIPSTKTSTKGVYTYDIFCTNGTLSSSDSFEFLINLGGVPPSTSRTDTLTRNIFIFIGLGVMAFIGFIYFDKFPVRASLFLLMIWFILMGLNFSFISLQDEVVNPSIENFFSSFLTISFYLNWFIFSFIILIWGVTFFVSIFDFKRKKRELKYGGYDE